MEISMDLAEFCERAFSADLLPVHFCVDLSESAKEISHIRPWGNLWGRWSGLFRPVPSP
ncbi:hypothetical protein DESC_610242 [Desulfosarcina cetonica]|nr:hypothetical protein DESC_610242 [Desulfosarcina cetonica]